MQYIRFVFFSVCPAAYLLCENLSATGAASASAGVLPALQAKLLLRCGKSRQRQTTSCVQVIWDKTLLSHCRVICVFYQTPCCNRCSLPLRFGSCPCQDLREPVRKTGIFLKTFLFKNTVCNKCSRHGLGGYCCRWQPSGLRFLIKTGKDSNLSRVFAYKMIR